jgi:hypothetical protein
MSYSVEARNDPPLLRVKLSGFWTMETFNAYKRDCGVEIEKLVSHHGRFDMLSDCNDFSIQGPDVSAAFEELKAMSDKMPQNRLAVVTGSALGRLQAERLVGNPHSRIFSTEAAALEWLGARNR